MTVFLLFITILSFPAHAGNVPDSTFISEQERKKIALKLLSPVFAYQETATSYGELDLHYRMVQGGFRKAQEPYALRSPSFQAVGYHQLGKFRLAGRFLFDKSLEDSLANGQKHNLDPFMTFYPYANKSGDYERQNYFAQTTLSYDVVPGWSPFLSLDYHKHWTAGKTDPRVKVDRFIFKVKPGLAFQAGKHAWGIYGILGKADEQSSLRYKNRDFQQSLSYPDRIHYMNYGFGSSVIKDSSTVYRYDDYRGLGAHYRKATATQELLLRVELERHTNNNYDKRKTSLSNNGPVGILELSSMELGLLWHKESTQNPGKQHQVTSSATFTSGWDGNRKTSGSLDITNYKLFHFHYQGGYSFRWDGYKGKNSYEIGSNMAYYHTRKEDVGLSLVWQSSTLMVEVPAIWHKRMIGSAAGYQFKVAPYVSFPLENQLTYNPLSLNNFIRDVVFTDHYYARSTHYGTSLYAEINRKMVGQNPLGLYIGAVLRKQHHLTLNPAHTPTFYPNGIRMEGQVGLKMYIQ